MNTKHITILYCLFASLYLGLSVFAPYPVSFLIKMIPALGDVLLDIDRIRFFVFGLGAFLMAHIFYSVTLFKFFKREHISYVKLGIVTVFCLTMLILVFPNLGPLAIPVIFYVLVISTMGIAASLAAPGFSVPYIDALIFILSDAIIAVDKFLVTVPFARISIMVTYFVGNFLIGYFTLKKTMKSRS